jgi:murein DD-endopeptidase MepM/ murein hydrolase activator NlpD
VHRASGVPLETALQHFVAIRSAQPRRKAVSMPAHVQQRWHALLSDTEEAALDEASKDTEDQQLRLFIRTRVTLEAEFEMDERRYKNLPAQLKARLKETLALLAERVRFLRQLTHGFVLQEQLAETRTLYLRFPVNMVNVTSYFGQRRDPIQNKQTRFHGGVDLGGMEGMLISSSGPGVVAYADWQGGSGMHVIVVHPNGYRTHYSHLSRIFVEPGQTVDEASPLGLMGSTGRSTGPHLHFAVSRHGAFFDPLEVLEVPLDKNHPAPRS